ncbi:hypothetical protein B0A48_10579 [Cryoendolithus antarcticus]|uniref:DUF7053 domain-containing protein n=1 Tax=Cryoendolithus antarcticus TaxID=1507870 RepID=A0A1V8SXQ6_9PEZI|nr:hypothetical protein B0A48_10579 [Cryoendolithus antarcticus]
MWRTTFYNTVTTPIPSDVKPAAVIKRLQDADFILSTSPFHISHRPLPSTPAGKENYEITDAIDILPFGLWKRIVVFSASFKDHPNGVKSHVEAPAGVVIDGDYTVKAADGAGDGEQGGMVLEEKVTTSVSVLLKLFVQANLVSSHRQNHLKIIEKAREDGIGA